MARISSHQHLKPQVFESFHNGGTPNPIIAQFGIPKSTAYEWYQQMCVKYAEITVASEIDSPKQVGNDSHLTRFRINH